MQQQAAAQELVALPFQRLAVRAVESTYSGRALLAADMGLGKTPMSLWFLLRNRCGSWPAVVICPATVKYGWEQVARSMGLMPMVAEGRRPPAVGQGMRRPRLLLINYEILHYWSQYIAGLGPQTLVIDESQYLASRSTQRTETVQDLARNCRNVLALSGTPLLNRPEELWPTLNVLRPDIYSSFWLFAQRYCAPRRGRYGGWDYSGASNLDELREELRRHLMIRILYTEVAEELPPVVRRVVPVAIERPHEYRQASTNFLRWLQGAHADRVTKAKKAENLVKVGYLLRLASQLKAASVVRWCNEFLAAGNEKLVVFAVHRAMIEALDKGLQGGRHAIITGDTTGPARQAAVRQFVHDTDTRVIIGNIRAMGTGLDGLQHAASTSVVAELPWQPAALGQLEARTRRMGQRRGTRYYYLVARGTIEERLCEVLQRKQEVLRAVLDGGMLPEDLNILDELVAAIEGMQPHLLQ